MLIDGSNISNNTVGTSKSSSSGGGTSGSDDDDGSASEEEDVLGAGVYIENFNTAVRDSTVAANRAVGGSGGAIALAAGSGRLTLEGNTTLARIKRRRAAAPSTRAVAAVSCCAIPRRSTL